MARRERAGARGGGAGGPGTEMTGHRAGGTRAAATVRRARERWSRAQGRVQCACAGCLGSVGREGGGWAKERGEGKMAKPKRNFGRGIGTEVDLKTRILNLSF